MFRERSKRKIHEIFHGFGFKSNDGKVSQSIGDIINYHENSNVHENSNQHAPSHQRISASRDRIDDIAVKKRSQDTRKDIAYEISSKNHHKIPAVLAGLHPIIAQDGFVGGLGHESNSKEK